jgi:hypothetical protein
MQSISFENGNKTIEAKITSARMWRGGDNVRCYIDLEFSKRKPIDSMYEVVEGGTRDKTITVGGRVFGYQLGGCDSHTKRDHATEAVKNLAELFTSNPPNIEED